MSDITFLITVTTWLSGMMLVIALGIFVIGAGWRQDAKGWSTRRMASVALASALSPIAMSLTLRLPSGHTTVLVASIAVMFVWFFGLAAFMKSGWFQPPESFKSALVARPQVQLKPRFRNLQTAAFVGGFLLCSPIWWLAMMRVGAYYGIGEDTPVRSHPNGGSFLGILLCSIPVMAILGGAVGHALLAITSAVAGHISWSEAGALGTRWDPPARWREP